MTQNRTALIVIDLQKDVLANAYDSDGVVSRVVGLVDRAHAEQVPVIWVQHNDEAMPLGSDQWQLDDRLVPADGDARIDKTYGDSFSNPQLPAMLERLGVRRLVIAGAQTDQCIRCTWHSALMLGYDSVLVSDAHTTEDGEFDGIELPARATIAQTNMYATWGSVYPDARGTATAADQVQFV